MSVWVPCSRTREHAPTASNPSSASYHSCPAPPAYLNSAPALPVLPARPAALDDQTTPTPAPPTHRDTVHQYTDPDSPRSPPTAPPPTSHTSSSAPAAAPAPEAESSPYPPPHPAAAPDPHPSPAAPRRWPGCPSESQKHHPRP